MANYLSPETSSFSTPSLGEKEFHELAKLVYDQCGIKLPIAKRTMLESRLSKRLRILNISSFKDYIDHVTSKEEEAGELIQMIDVVTTNKTDFFREHHHFEFLHNDLLPAFSERKTRKEPFRFWSAACSTGEEPYTAAMVLNAYKEQTDGFDYSIFASDVSTKVLIHAKRAVYSESRVDDIPVAFRKKYLLRSKDRSKPSFRIGPELRKKVSFGWLNFMNRSLDVEGSFDVIFCRNTLIYFDRPTQAAVVTKLIQKLKPGGYLFIGHSESLFQHDLPLRQVMPTVYQLIEQH